MKKTFTALAMFGALGIAAEAHAELFKCKDAGGKVSYQETPCSGGHEQKRIATEAPNTNPELARGQARSIGTDNDKRIPLDRQPAKVTVDACIALMRPDLQDVRETFTVNAKLYQRLWLTPAGPADRLLVAISIREKNKLEAAQTSLGCVLNGDGSTIDAGATAALQ